MIDLFKLDNPEVFFKYIECYMKILNSGERDINSKILI